MSSTLHRIVAGMGPYYDPDFANVLCLVQDVDPSDTLIDQSPSPRAITKAAAASFSAYGQAPRGNGRVLSVSSTGEVWRMVGDASWTFFHNTAGSRPANTMTIEVIAKAPTTGSVKVYIKPNGNNLSGRASSNYFSVSVASDNVKVLSPERYSGSTDSQATYILNSTHSAGQWVYAKAWYDLDTKTCGVEANGQTSSIDYLQSGSYNAQYNINRCDVYAEMHSSGQLFAVRVTKGIRAMERQLYSLPFPVFGGTINTRGDSAPSGPGQRVLAPGDTFIVPAGVTAISAVCVGTKLSISGADVVSAARPRIGDGGGLGGAGGVGLVTSEQKPIGPGFGGGAPPPEYIITVTPGGGGGAGGYGGDGGAGEPGVSGSYSPTGSKGAGGGGRRGFAGGGVGLRGKGSSGGATGGAGSPGSADGPVYGGGNGGAYIDGAQNAVDGADLAWKNAIAVTPGQAVLCTRVSGGSSGAARIIWGTGRSYPDNAWDL